MVSAHQGRLALHRAEQTDPERSRCARTSGAAPLAVESFNGRLRDALLNETLFSDLRQARTALLAWRQDDTTCRPHSAPGNVPPAEFAAQIGLDEKAA